MSKIAFVFAGQGTQTVGMGKDLMERFDALDRSFEKANEILQKDLKTMMFEGPLDTLSLTENTQPAVFLASYCGMLPLIERNIIPDVCAGLSLGEYTAHVCAGTLTFEDAVFLLQQRGRFMQSVVPVGKGGMAVALGLTEEELDPCVQKARKVGEIYYSNFNTPEQVTVSGQMEALDAFVDAAKAAGAKRSMKLDVSAPFHCPMLKKAGDKLGAQLAGISINSMKMPVISNVTAKPVTTKEDVKELLVRQVYEPVRWYQSVQWMIQFGVDVFVEIGPGKVLRGLIKKIDKSVTVHNVSDTSTLDKTLEALCGS